MNDLPGGPGRPGRPGKPSLPGGPAAPIVVWPGFPLSPLRPGTPWRPRAPGTPGRISPHSKVTHVTLLFRDIAISGINWKLTRREELGKAFVLLLHQS